MGQEVIPVAESSMAARSVATQRNAKISELSVETHRAFRICFLGIFHSFIGSETVRLLVELDHSAEALAVARNAFGQIAAIPPALIKHVRSVVGFAKIVPRIIEAVAVPVVYFWNVISSFHSPYYSMNHPTTSAQANASVPIVRCIRSFSKMFGIPLALDQFSLKMVNRADFPHQYASHPIVIEALAQERLGW